MDAVQLSDDSSDTGSDGPLRQRADLLTSGSRTRYEDRQPYRWHPHQHQHPHPQPRRSPRTSGRARRRAAAGLPTPGSSGNQISQNTDGWNGDGRRDCSPLGMPSRHRENGSRARSRRHSGPSLTSLGLGLLTARSNAVPGNASAHGPPDPPPLRVIAAELGIFCSLYMRYLWQSIHRLCGRARRVSGYVIIRLAVCSLLIIAWCTLNFFQDAVNVCTPPSDLSTSYNADGHHDNPLVEYYVHGRGIGHYARSVAIVDQLNEAGVDVRLFLSRASMWRAMHEDSKLITHAKERRGSTRAIAVSSLTPSMNFFSVISHVMERIISDCEVSISHRRYPKLVISDGDLPGMLRAKLGGIPSVGIAHGQLFHIAQTPSWIADDSFLRTSWERQASLNFRSSFFSEWQIATHFCFLESAVGSGTVARAPMRPEVRQMARARRFSQRTGTFAPSLPRESQVKHLLLDSLEMSRPDSPSNPQSQSQSHNSPVHTERRKIVICYFRDRNGAVVTKALLQAGFDVLLFDNGYFRNMLSDPNRYGAKWIVHNHDEVRTARGIPFTDIEQNLRADRLRREDFNSTRAQPDHQRRRYRRRLMEGTADADAVGTSDATGRLGPPRLIRVMDRSMFVPLMHVADGVASSAGSQLMSECIFSEMPLLAHYLESDDEQRLNVELSRHTDSSCQKPHVYGNSFETLAMAATDSAELQDGMLESVSSNRTGFLARLRKRGTKRMRRMWNEFDSFVNIVQTSKVSDSFYRFYERYDGVADALDGVLSNNATEYNEDEVSSIFAGNQEEENHLNGLPEAAEIILEIIKRVGDDGQ